MVIKKKQISSVRIGAYEPAISMDGLKLHSWGFDKDDGNPTFNLEFDNLLSDLSIRVNSKFNKNEDKTNFGGNLKYGKYFTVVAFNLDYLNRSIKYHSNDTILAETFNETNSGVEFSIPLNWYYGTYSKQVFLSSTFTLHNTSNYRNSSESINDFSLQCNSVKVAFSNIQSQAYQNILLRFGQKLIMEYRTSLTDISAELININSTIFLPSLVKNHGIKLDGNWQRELTTNQYQFSDYASISRGYSIPPKDESFQAAFNNAFPIAYPDWGYAGLTYFKRLRANVFYDFGGQNINSDYSQLNSYGMEIILDNTFLNLIPMSIGLRQSFLLNEDPTTPAGESKFEIFLDLDDYIF